MTTESRIREIQDELARLETRLNEPFLPLSDQQLLAEAWQVLHDELDEINPWPVIGEFESPPGGSPVPRPPTPVPEGPRMFIDYNAVIPISEEEQRWMNETVDDRCTDSCSCLYCMPTFEGYDPSGEI